MQYFYVFSIWSSPLSTVNPLLNFETFGGNVHATALQKKVSAGSAPRNVKSRNLFGNGWNWSRNYVSVRHFSLDPCVESWSTRCSVTWLAYAAQRNKTERDLFHEVLLDGEILVFTTTAIVAEVEIRTELFEKLVSQRKLKNLTWDQPCYMAQCQLKLIWQRRYTWVSHDSSQTDAALYTLF